MIRITYLSHSCFLIEGGGSRLIIDPFLKGNPNAPVTPEEIEVEYVLTTHGHPDHLGDAVEIANRNNAVIVAPFELGLFCERQGAKNVHAMHYGTFPVLTPDAEAFREKAEDAGISVRILGFGEGMELN